MVYPVKKTYDPLNLRFDDSRRCNEGFSLSYVGFLDPFTQADSSKSQAHYLETEDL